MDLSRDFYSVKQAAQELGISENAVRLRIKAGTLEHQRVGEWTILIPKKAIEKEKKAQGE